MMKKVFYVGASTFLLVSCTQKNMPVNDSVETTSNSNRITLNQALKTSARMMKQLDGGNTRSAFRIVGDVKVISQAKTRGDQNNAVSYKKIKFLNNKAVPNK